MSDFENTYTDTDDTGTYSDALQELADTYTNTCDPGAHPYSERITIDDHSISEVFQFKNNHINITEKISNFENALTQIKSDLDEIKEAIMAINRKMDSY